MNTVFIYALIFGIIVLLIYYIVIVYMDVLKLSKEKESSELFIPSSSDFEENLTKSVQETDDGLIVGTSDNEEKNNEYIDEDDDFVPSFVSADTSGNDENAEAGNDGSSESGYHGYAEEVYPSTEEKKEQEESETKTESVEENGEENPVEQAAEENEPEEYVSAGDIFDMPETEHENGGGSGYEVHMVDPKAMGISDNDTLSDTEKMNDSLEQVGTYTPGEMSAMDYAMYLQKQNKDAVESEIKL